MAQTTLDRFVKDLQKLGAQLQAETANKLANGQCANWDEYNKMTGKVQGIAMMGNIAYELLKKRDLAETPDDGRLSDLPDGGES